MWKFLAGPWGGAAPTVELPATGRQVSFSLGQASTGQFTIDGGSSQAGQLYELLTDVWVLRDDELLLRGRLGAGQGDTLDGTSDVWQPTFIDYRGVLRRQQLYPSDTLAYHGFDTCDIPWRLLNSIQGHLGLDAGITASTSVRSGTVTPSDFAFNAGQYFSDAVDQLAGQTAGGFDWSISTGMQLQLWPSGRGVARPDVYEYGGAVIEATRVPLTDQFGNALLVTGGTGTTPVTVDAPDIASRPEGRWDLSVSLPDITSQAALVQYAAQQLGISSTLPVAYTCTLAPGVWDPTRLWLGDTATLVIRTGRLSVNAAARVSQIDVTVGDDDVEQVVVTFGAPRLSLQRRLKSYEGRLSVLERTT